MKMKILSLFAALALMLALTFPAAAPAAPPAGRALPASGQPAAAQRHPEIHEAIESLRHARAHIHDAAHDFDGHKEEALRAVDEAIHQLQICEKFDR
ncbi:MAG: hypothetical protein WCA98_06360 [Candidatus Acidiferrales bacterium]